MRYVLGPWLWETGDDTGPYWRAPDGCAGMLDIRSIPQQSITGGTPEGYGIFALRPSAPNPGSSYRLLGTALDDTISPAVRSTIAGQLGVTTLESNRLNRVLNELLTMKGDHTGETFARPIMPNMRRQMTIGLAGLNVHRERFQHDSIQHKAARRQMREQYRANRIAESEGRMPPGHHRRILDFMQKKLRIPWQNLVPPEHVGDPGPLPHRTIITESFNTADSNTLGPDLTWTEITGDWDVLSNECTQTTISTNSTARADSDLSSDDHYGQCDVTAISSGSALVLMGPTARNSASAETCYTTFPYQNDDKQYLRKIVSGTPTDLTTAVAITLGIPEAYKCECDGSSIKGYQAGAERISATDSAISGNTRCGLRSWFSSAGTYTVDNFEAADLAAGGGLSIPIAMHHYKQLMGVN